MSVYYNHGWLDWTLMAAVMAAVFFGLYDDEKGRPE
jgi:hypothetical protein